MSTQAKPGDGHELTDLFGTIGHLSEELVRQQFALLTSEVRHELRKAVEAALAAGGGAASLAVSGVLSTFMLVHLLHRSTRLPLWACYGLAAGASGAVGLGLLAAGRERLAAVRLLEVPQTVQGLQENLAWLKEQLTPPPK